MESWIVLFNNKLNGGKVDSVMTGLSYSEYAVGTRWFQSRIVSLRTGFKEGLFH